MKKFKKKILAMITVMALLFANFVPNFSSIIDASAAAEPAFPSVDKVIAKAATLLGTPYGFGKKGYSGIYDLGHYGKLSLDYVRSQGIDCSGLIYYTMTQLGYKTSGFEFQNPVPVDTAHWLSVNSSSTITYGGVTAKVDVEKKNISTNSRPYWQCSDGTTITPGSVVIAQNPNGEDHSWIYIGEFASRAEVITYLKKIGVSTSLINTSTVGDGKGDGGTHWRIEANSGRGVCINNNTDGKSSSAFNMYAFRITDHTATFEIHKYDADEDILVGKSDVDGSTAVYYIYSDKACKNKVGSITIGTNGKGSIKLPNATYYAKEIKAPWGYKLDTNVHTIKAGVNKVTETSKKGNIFIQKYAENEYISRMDDFPTLQKYMYFAVQRKNGSSWQYVAFTVSGNTYTYNGKTTNDPFVIRLDNNGAFKLLNLPYGTYRIYESWRASADILQAAGLQDPPSIPVKEFMVESDTDTQEIVNYKLVGPDVTFEKRAEDESIINVTNYSAIKSGMYFALQTPVGNGSSWQYVYVTKNGNRYTYDHVGSGYDPYQIKLDDNGEFILSGLPYGKYRLYEQWRGSPTALKEAGLQNPPSSYIKEFVVSEDMDTTQDVINSKVIGGSLEIDKKVTMADPNTPIPESAYTDLTFTIKNKSGQYLVLDTVDAAAGTYKYKSTTATEASATKIKLGTSTHKAVVTDMPIDTGYVVKEICGDPRFKAYSDKVTVNIVAETSSDAPFSNYEVYGSVKGVKVDKNNPDKKLVGAVYGLFKEGTTTFNTSTAYKTATSGSDGVFTFDKVPYGNYIIRELTAPKGYKLSTEQKNVTISSQGQTVSVEVADPPINIWFSKKSVTGNAELAGAKMQLHTSTGSVIDSWTSGSSAHLVECVAAGSYILHEEAAPNGYVLAQDISFNVDTNGNVTGVSTTSTADSEPIITMTDDITKVTVYKVDITNDKELAGAKLQIKDSTGKVVDEWTSTNEPHKINGKLIAGATYTLHEEIAPDGYVVAQDVAFTVDPTGKVTEVTMTDDVTKITVSKKTITGSDELVGAKMQLLDSNGTVVDEWISTSEPHDIYGKLVAGQTYTLHEEYAPNGYVIASDIEFTVSADGSIDVVEMHDDTTKVQISKKTITGDDELAGAKLQVKDSSGNVVDEWTSTDTPHYIEGKLIAGATYTLHEEFAPNGYVVANDITFVVSEDGSIDTVKMVDDTTKVQISKQDITNGKELAGAKLQVKDSDGNVVEEWTSTDTPHYIEGKLIAGATYTLHEEYAPNGYVIANDITFVVSEDGSVDTVKMVDDTTKVQISKQDITNGKELAGAKLQVKDSDGNVVEEWTSTDTPHYIEGKLIAGATYTLHEEVAPDGYVIASDIEFTVSDDGSIDTVVMKDDIAKGTVEVHKNTEGMLNIEGIDLVLSGVSFLGLDVNITSTTDENGIAVFVGVPVGTYTITEEESTVPYGYLVADPIEGVEVVYAQQTDVEIFNAEMTGSIAVNKTTEGMVNLEGIEFILSGVTDAGREIELKVLTDEAGTAIFENVPIGTYTITENGETVPYGYLVADPIEGVEVIYAQQTDVEIFNAEMTGSIAVSKTTEGMINLKDIEFVLSGVTDTGREIELKVLTDEAGAAIFENVPIGTYMITENGETVPYGYLTADPVEGVEVIYAQQTDVEIFNAEMTGSIRVQKKTEGMKDLEGIGFKLSGTTDTGREISLYVKTDKDGLAVFEEVPVGTYTLTEDGQTVPKGYLIARAVEGVEVVYSEQTDITVVNDKVPENPKTGDTAPYAAVAVCTLIAAALLLRKRTDNSVD